MNSYDPAFGKVDAKVIGNLIRQTGEQGIEMSLNRDWEADHLITRQVVEAFVKRPERVREFNARKNRTRVDNWLGHEVEPEFSDAAIIDQMLINGATLRALSAACQKRTPEKVLDHLDHLKKDFASNGKKSHRIKLVEPDRRSDLNGFWQFDRTWLGATARAKRRKPDDAGTSREKKSGLSQVCVIAWETFDGNNTLP
ncbi:MAG TPA: hypothetical protein VGJ26_14290 [Pirellulales bacterium]